MLADYLEHLEHALGETLALNAAQRQPMMALCRERLLRKPHGDLSRWMRALMALPACDAQVLADQDTVTIRAGDAAAVPRPQVTDALRGLMPWRKGPFNFFDVTIDTEWRSDWKWQRVAPHLAPLDGRDVLDVGCGSGYHCWRMKGAGAASVLGIDPTPLFFVQYLAVQRYWPGSQVWHMPLRMEELPAGLGCFDTVFSMGVLYHRRSPLDHLLELKAALKPGGQLVLETLVVAGDEQQLLFPQDRYSAMRNVYFLPSSAMLLIWLQRCGFVNARCVDESNTTIDEQRQTEWMQFQSLPDFLDPEDASRTREGYPAPRRAVVIAELP